MSNRRQKTSGNQHLLFAPDWGDLSWKLWDIVEAVAGGDPPVDLIDVLADLDLGGADEHDRLRAAFSISLLQDVLNAGGSAEVRDSRLLVRWPDWSGTSGRQSARRALGQARTARPLRPDELRRIQPFFAPDLDGGRFEAVLREAEFVLRPVDEVHASGSTYQQAFSAALRHWTMPYRGRTGRARRFVVTAQHEYLGQAPVIAGLLELGDEAPFCTWRDDLLGLSPRSFHAWWRDSPSERAAGAAERLRLLRCHVRPTAGGLDLSTLSAEQVVRRRPELEGLARGRSRVLEAERDLLKDRKRIAHALRLARGEAALRKLATGVPFEDVDTEVNAGVRGLHDIVIPRMHLEVSVCGAIPPFSAALGGKLMVTFFAHPHVIKATLGAEGELLGWSFDLDGLVPLLPAHGLLCITTKGLYEGHAAIYNRAEMPGIDGPLRLRHLANTRGVTTTLVSDATVRLARRLLDHSEGGSVSVSNVYGSGGAKRHRVIEHATRQVGLPVKLAMAGIRRPVYGHRFAANPASIAWLGEEPEWLVDAGCDPTEYCMRAVELWRSRWLERGVSRIREFALLPSLLRDLETQGEA